jgi:hypothetical protein
MNGGHETYLIHILAKHDTAMKARRTEFGRVPARLSTRVINTRSMLVLLRADAIVKPPISNIMVGENMTEKMNLKEDESWLTNSLGVSLSCIWTRQSRVTVL